jgi:acetyltransferase-like isoleucine patch superfamily enzyme
MKKILKAMADVSAKVVAAPAIVSYALNRAFVGEARAFPGWSQAMSLIPGTVGAYLRRAFYRFAFRQCAQGSWIGFGTVFSHAGCRVGRNAYVGCYCCLGEVTLEDDVLIGSHVSITNGSAQHGISRLDIPIREQPGQWPHITIGQDSWIGDRAVVMANVGKHCVIGAGSVVTKSVPDYAIVVGNPAKILRYRNELEVERLERVQVH